MIDWTPPPPPPRRSKRRPADPHNYQYCADPLKLQRVLWPDLRFYDRQVEVIYSVAENRETIVHAGNMLGKDFVAAFITLWFFLTRKPVRIVTTSVDGTQLEGVLWGEIRRLIETAARPLTAERGGPIVNNHLHLKKVYTNGPEKGRECGLSYCIGRVAAKGEGMLGHHIAQTGDGVARTLFVADEACHDSETEVLTDGGWKRFASLTGDEKFLSMDPVTRRADYLPATHVYASRYSGPMYLRDRRSSNFCVTPAHRMLWKRRRSGCEKSWSPYYLERMDALNGTDRAVPRQFAWEGVSPATFAIPELTSDRKFFRGREVATRDWLDLLAWYLSEGSVGFVSGVPYRVLIHQKSEQTRQEIAALFRRLGFDPKLYVGQSPAVTVHERRLAEYLLECGRYCWEKRVPGFVGTLSPELIEGFLKTYTRGDGYDRGNRDVIYTSSPGMADDLQVLSFKAGREATVQRRSLEGLPAPNGTSRRDGYVVGRREAADDHVKLWPGGVSKVDYSGEVFCVRVPPYHTIFTRRNGTCMWGGNSGVDDVSWDRAETWANRKLAIGNPYPCSNFFYRAVEGGPRADGGVEPGGDLIREDGTFYRKVIHVKGEDSPNVQLALKTQAYGGVPSGEIVLPGVLPWADYQDRRRNWDKVRQCIGLDGLFWKGADALLFPPDWLDRAGRIARALRGRVRRAEAIGVDPGEGEANTAMVAVDRWGVIELFSAPTPDTDEVPRQVLAFMRRHGLDRGDGPSKVYFDRGGGGKQHADRMRASGYNVQTVGFGEAVVPPPRPGVVPAGELRDARESRYAYENRRAEMYGLLSELLNPAREVTSEGVDGEGGTGEPVGFGLPDEYGVLRQQLAPIPRLLSEEGRLYLPPKNRKPGDRNKSKKTLTELVGRSPDEADALVLAVYGMIRRPRPASAGGFY